jgi:hypothetical protein
MNLQRKLVLLGVVAATVSLVDAAVANAYETIDYGTNQAACRIAVSQARAAGIRYANCFETGPGSYSFAWDD